MFKYSQAAVSSGFNSLHKSYLHPRFKPTFVEIRVAQLPAERELFSLRFLCVNKGFNY